MPLNEGVRGGPQRGRRKSRSLCSRAMRRAGKVSPGMRIWRNGVTVGGLPDERSKRKGPVRIGATQSTFLFCRCHDQATSGPGAVHQSLQ